MYGGRAWQLPDTHIGGTACTSRILPPRKRELSTKIHNSTTHPSVLNPSSKPTFSAVTFLQGVQLPHQQPDVSRPGASSAASCSVGTVSAAHSDQGARLQEQREQAAKLRVLSKKDSYLRGAMALYIQGCLSWVQQAKLRIAMVRRPVPVVSIATRAQKMRAGRAWG